MHYVIASTFIAKARLPIGRDGRNRPKLFPFGTVTGRNAHAQSPYNAHAGMRSFMKFAPSTIGFYLDWRSQEVGIAATLSGDRTLMEDYAAGDIYHALALMCGLTDEPDPIRWKELNRAQRDRMKPLQLGINYGMGVPSLARGLDRHPLIASEIIERHKRRYPRFWQWRAEMVQVAMLERRIESLSGWPLRITHSPNQRTLYNFPMQSGGADMTRLATVRLCNAGIVPIMLIHDGILFEETEPEKIAEAMEIMRGTGRDICDGFEIGVDIDQRLENGARLSRQATNGAKDVEHHHGSPADDRRVAGEDCRMSNPRLVTAHGRQILVETLETPDMPTRGRKTKKQEEFAIVPLRWMAEATKTTDTGGAMVLVLLRYLAWKNESSTFSLSNAMFTRYGIARETKRRVLRKLEAAGWLKIERGPGRALIVTLLRVS